MSTQDPTSDAGFLADSPRNGNGNGTLTTIDNRAPVMSAAGWAVGPPPRPEILSAKPNPIELLHAARRRWTLAIGLGVMVGSIAGGLVWFFVPVRYEAFALLRVTSAPPAVLDRVTTGPEEFMTFKRTQVQLILSNMVLRRTVSEPDITKLSVMQEHNDDQVSWLKGQLIIDYPDDSEILRIAIKTQKPAEATKIVNKVVEKYISEIVQRERTLRDEHENKLEQAFLSYVDKCKQDLDKLHKLQTIYKTSSTEAAQVTKRLELETLGELLGDRKHVMDQLTHNKQETMLLEAGRDHAEEFQPSDAVIELALAQDKTITEYGQGLLQLQEMLADEVEKRPGNEGSRKVKELRKKIGRAEQIIEQRRAILRPKLMDAQVASATGHGSSGIARTLPVLEREREYLEEGLEKLTEDIEKQADKLTKLEDFNVDVAAKRDELMASQKITTDLRSQLDRIHVERLAPERITSIDDANLTNGGGDAMRKYVAMAFAITLGFGVVVVAVAFVEFQSRKVNSVHEVNDGLGIRVIGELPSLGGRAWRRVPGGKGPAVLKALMAERIDGTRTNLMHTTAIDPPRVVMVTSAEPREGKTTTASQLAASLARSGRRTLFIDADIRNPGAHRVFEMPQEPGLCELLRGEAERDAVIHPTRTANLWLLPAGRCDLRSVQALSTSYLGTAIAALGVQFDYIVIESGPVLKVADALMVGQHVDAAIMSVLRDVSKVPNVYEACERLRSVGITVLGAVVNGVNDDVARHGVELLLAETASETTK
jgi:capsular exopolysaccharide synthesis family protein